MLYYKLIGGGKPSYIAFHEDTGLGIMVTTASGMRGTDADQFGKAAANVLTIKVDKAVLIDGNPDASPIYKAEFKREYSKALRIFSNALLNAF